MKYSFIIPVKAINDYIKESVSKINLIKRDDYEIIIYPDEVDASFQVLKTRQISTGHVGPAEKRTLAINDAQGEILVFIDDDAYPQEDFLNKLDSDFFSKSSNDFINNEVLAVGGPAITPKTDSFWQKVSGAVFLSSLSGGNPERYASKGKKRNIDDWPSVNFSIRKKIFAELNGFDSQFWPGEDTKLCLELIKKYPKSIIYDPELVVFHHRRSGLFRHLKQVGGYGLHRGWFARKYPETSRKLKYFIPSLFFLFIVIGGFLSIFNKIIFGVYLIGWVIYLLALIKAVLDIRRYENNLLICASAIYYIFLTHLFYGLMFIRGFLFTKKLKSKLR
jgi:glycosyltransferase involved in cell wall biosynthesis